MRRDKSKTTKLVVISTPRRRRSRILLDTKKRLELKVPQARSNDLKPISAFIPCHNKFYLISFPHHLFQSRFLSRCQSQSRPIAILTFGQIGPWLRAYVNDGKKERFEMKGLGQAESLPVLDSYMLFEMHSHLRV